MAFRQTGRMGFTMVELLMVVVLLGVLAGSALMIYSTTDSDIATAGAMMVMRDLEFAQSEAIRRQTPVTATFTAGSPRYTLTDASGALTSPFTGEPYPVSLATILNNGRISISAVSLGSGGSVTFSSLGEPLQSDGGSPVGNSNYILVTCGGETVRLRITPLTGQPYTD